MDKSFSKPIYENFGRNLHVDEVNSYLDYQFQENKQIKSEKKTYLTVSHSLSQTTENQNR